MVNLSKLIKDEADEAETVKEKAEAVADSARLSIKDGKAFLFQEGMTIDKQAPRDTAKLFIGLRYWDDAKNVSTLVHWQGGWCPRSNPLPWLISRKRCI
jgi:hypothetical protein